MKYTESELYAFVSRADTNEKIAIAEDWLTKHVDDNDLWNDLMMALSQQSRMINAQTLKTGEKIWF